MAIHNRTTRSRRPTLPRRRRTRALLALLVAGVVGVPVAWASHQFGDVPTTNPHHDDVGVIAQAGITAGCNPPANTLYCPDQPVRRDQMASFLTRGLPRIAVSQTALVAAVIRSPALAWTDVSEVTVIVGGAGMNARQFVKVDASLNVFSTHECMCLFRLRILDVSTGHVAHGGFWQTAEQDSDHTYTAVGVFDAAPGPRTFRLQMWYAGYQGPPPGAGEHSLAVGQPYLVATTYPILSGSAAHNAVPDVEK